MKALQNEAEWLPEDLHDLPAVLEELRPLLFEAGRSSSEVNGITGWLFAKAIGEPDETGSATRARYRRILRELGAVPPGGPRRLVDVREAGVADLRRAGSTAALALVGAGAVSLASSGNVIGAVLAAALSAPIMLDEPRYVGSTSGQGERSGGAAGLGAEAVESEPPSADLCSEATPEDRRFRLGRVAPVLEREREIDAVIELHQQGSAIGGESSALEHEDQHRAAAA